MTSEIRANTLKNRVGLGTVSFTNTGPVVSGIVTANSFSGPLTSTSIDLNGDLDVDGHTNLDNVSVTGVTTFSDNIRIVDGKKLLIGSLAAGDCQFIHDGTDTFIQNKTGDLKIANNVAGDVGGNIIIQAMNGENSINCVHDAQVELCWNGTKKFETGNTVNINSNHFEITSGQQLRFDNSNNNRSSEILNTGSSGNSSLSFKTNGNERVEIDSTGNVQIKGTNKEIRWYRDNNNFDRYGAIFYDGSQFTLQNPVNDNFQITTSGGTLLYKFMNSGKMGIGISQPDSMLHIHTETAGTVTADADADELVLESSGNTGMSILSPGTGESSIYFGNPGTNGQKDAWIKYYHETHSTTANRRALTFRTSGAERFRIDGSGRVLIGNTSDAGHSGADDLTIHNSGNGGITIRTGTTSNGAIFFADSTSGDARFDGFVQYNHGSSPYMMFGTSDDERLRIDSDGRCIVGGGAHAGGSALVVKGGNQNSYSTIGMFSNHTNPGDNTLLSQIRFGANATAVGADIRVYADADWANNDYPTRMEFYTTPDGSNSRQARIQIDKDGKTSISKNGFLSSDKTFALTVHTGSTSDSNNAVNDGIMIVSQNNNGNQNSTTGKVMWCGHAQTNGPFIYAKNAQAYGKKDLVINTHSTANDYTTQLEETARFSYTGALRVNKIEPLAGLVSGQMGGVIQVKWTANVDNGNYSSTSDMVMQTVNITPTRSNARMLIHVVYPSVRSYTTGNTRHRLTHHIKRDGTEIYTLGEVPQWRSANFGSSGVEITTNVVFTHIDSPSTTSQVTYTATWQSVDGHIWNTAGGQMTMIVAELTGY